MTRRWDRIEPNHTSSNLELGLRAAVADPLWLLGRQWQLGELRGEDAATPVKVRIKVSIAPLETYRSDVGDGAVETLSGDRPLESVAEPEPVSSGPAFLRLAADAGLQLARRVEPEVRASLRAAYPLRLDGIDLSVLPARDARELLFLAARAIDGAAIAAASEPVAPLPEAHRAAAREAIRRWRRELDVRYQEPLAAGAWSDANLEYRFSVSAATPSGEVVLAARYPGGHLDWYSFDVAPKQTHGLATGGHARTFDAIPTPLAYRGMPASRYWELEEGSVYFGDLEAGPSDLARLLVAEFATTYSDDWSVIPIRARAGCLARIERMTLVDTFGDHHVIPSTAAKDGSSRVFTMFELARDPSADHGTAPWLFVPTTTATSLVGRPVESVTMVRDEVANLAWGVEETFEAATGRAVGRRLISARAMPPSPPRGDEWAYRVATPVPPHWVPLVPEPDARGGMILRRGRMSSWDTLDPAVVGARGRFLLPDPNGPLRIREEAIPRGGVELSRAWQLARGSDGKLHVWMSRERRPGRGERGSGLEMDRIER